MTSIPLWPASWYAVEQSSNLKKGAILEKSLAGSRIVIYRSESGEAVALDSHCPHMGAHLKAACVRGEKLRCALHHWEIGQSGSLFGDKGEELAYKTRVWPTLERFGLLFVYAGNHGTPPFPVPEDQDYLWMLGPPKSLNADWRAILINGYDIHHMRTVHQRSLVQLPLFYQSSEYIQMEYSSRIERHGGVSSWLTKLISKDNINIRSTCYGTSIKIESTMNRRNARAIFFSFPKDVSEGGTTVFPVFGIPKKTLFPRLQLMIAKYLYMAFLSKDFSVVDGMKLIIPEPISDIGVRNIVGFLGNLEAAPYPTEINASKISVG